MTLPFGKLSRRYRWGATGFGRLVPAGTVPRTEVGKAVRVARWAGGEPPLPGLG